MKVKGPLFSLGARGSIAGRIAFSQKRTGQQARWQKAQKDADSTDQGTQRAYFTEAITYWHSLDADEQEQWNTYIIT